MTTVEVYKEAVDAIVTDSGVLLLIDDEYNNLAGFAPGQWISFEEIIENYASETTVDHA